MRKSWLKIRNPDANDILTRGAEPATYPPRTTERGPLVVNVERAGMLGITLTEHMGIEEYVGRRNTFKEYTNDME